MNASDMENSRHDLKQPTQRLLQFSLRAFLVVTTLVAVASGIFLSSIRRQQVAVSTIEKHGGSVGFGSPVSAEPSKIPSWMIDLFGEDTFHRVTKVNINTRTENNALHQNTKHEPEVWDALSSLPHVQHFSMDYATVPSESFEKISCLSELEQVHISNVVLDSASVEAFSSLKELRSVYIYGGQLKDSALDVFAQLPKLHTLTLEGKFSNDGLATISNASSLTKLALNGEGSAIDDEGIPHLANLKKLKTISLQNSLVTGDGLRKFAGMKSVKVFNLKDTNVTWNDADAFKKEIRPDVKFVGYMPRAKTGSP